MRGKRGFTILELLVVLGIIGIMLALLTLKLGASLEDAKETRIEADLSVLVASGEQFLQRHPKETVESQEALVEMGLLKAIVKSPVDGYYYEISAGEGRVCARLMKGAACYEKGDYRAEKISTRLYLD
ncbi:MAG: type II secretion system protein [Peptococcaceae bacterium]|nr:type II secretion system protein [Peptococcaceae bacterium]